MDSYIRILTYIIMTPLIIVTIVGNILTLIVKLYRRKMKSFNSGDLFIVNLAICDLNKTWNTFFVWIYNAVMHDEWQFSKISCSVFQKSVIILFSVSSLTLLVLTTERYLIVAKPFNRSFTFKRAQILLAVIWITIIALNLVPFFTSFTTRKVDGKVLCRSSNSNEFAFAALVFYYVIMFFIPGILILVLSRMAAAVLMKNSKTDKNPRMKYCKVFNGKMRRNKSAIYILRSISLGYFICYVPWALIYLLDTRHSTGLAQALENSLLMPAMTWLIFGSFCNTPVTYIIFSLEFRKEIRKIFTRSKIRTGPSGQDRTGRSKIRTGTGPSTRMTALLPKD